MEINQSLYRKILKKIILLCLSFFAIPFAFCFSSIEAESFVQGLSSYKNGDWEDACLYLKQSVNSAEYDIDSNWYMIIMSEVYSGNYNDTISDCNYFIENYSDSNLISFVEYQRGRAYHSVGLNDNAVMALSSFCNEYPDSEMYSSALFWIAECFYDDYDFETARALYERIVTEYPNSSKKEDSEFKLYLITQHDREQKLLYLLKMTGEEYINYRETYEKQLRMMQTDDMAELRKQLKNANARINELENNVSAKPSPVAIPKENIITSVDSAMSEESFAELEKEAETEITNKTASQVDEEMLSLKAKAALIQRLLNEEKGEGK